jgi:hypothetical protein
MPSCPRSRRQRVHGEPPAPSPNTPIQESNGYTLIFFFSEHAVSSTMTPSHIRLFAASTMQETRTLEHEGMHLIGAAWLPTGSKNYAEIRVAPSSDAALVCPSLVATAH